MQTTTPAIPRKRRIISPDVDSGSETDEIIHPVSLPSERLISIKETRPVVQKSRRGRPKKIRVEAVPSETVSGEASGSSVPTVPVGDQLDEITLALQYIGKNKRPSTKLAYRMPLAVWKEYCDGFGGDTVYPYTVGSAAKVVDFFNNCVFKKTYTKYVPIGTDFRTQVSLQNSEDTEQVTSL
ncbi:unnamed protein product [Mucor hiemalis]